MIEYGNGVGQVAGGAGGGAPGGSVDLGASVGQFVNDSIQTLSTMPPATILLGLVIVVLGLLVLKRAF
jgi:hypothetical protein